MRQGSVRGRIGEYLRACGRPVRADEVLRAALGIHSPNAIAADKVLRSIVGEDPDFRSEMGLWMIAPDSIDRILPAWPRMAFLYLQAAGQAQHPSRVRACLWVRDTSGSSLFSYEEPASEASIAALKQARETAGSCLLVAWSPKEIRLWNQRLRVHALPEWQGESFYLSALLQRVFPGCGPARAPEDLASMLGLASPDTDDPAAMSRFYAEVWLSLLDHVPMAHRQDPGLLAGWIKAGKPRIDFSRFSFGREFLSEIPERPGVYIMRNRAGDMIYVGKSGNLKTRVRSYFAARALGDPKIARIHEQLHSLEYTVTPSEVEALLLEMRLIRDFQPQINLQTEIHEQPAHYGRERNLIVLVRTGQGTSKATAYFLRNSAFVSRESVRLGCGPSRRLQAKIKSVYFSRRKKSAPGRKAWEPEVVARWLRAHMKRLNAVDVDQAGTYESVILQLRSCLGDPQGLSTKVFYR